MPFRHQIHRIVVLPVVVDDLPILENEGPVSVEPVRLHRVFDIISAGFVERCSLVVVCDAATVSYGAGAGVAQRQ